MQADLLIVNAGQLVTCASRGRAKRGKAMADVGVIHNGAVAIADGKFVGLGTTDDVVQEFAATEIRDAGRKVICPGFVDPHTHIVYAGDRLDEFEQKIKGANYLEVLAAGGGIISTVRATRRASTDQLLDASLKRLDKMLACGTTVVEIKTGYGLDLETELRMLAVIERLDQRHAIDVIPTFLAAHAVPPEFRNNSEDYVNLICDEMLAAAWKWYERSSFIRQVPFFVDVFTEENAFDLAQSKRILERAKSFGFAIKAHVDEFTNLGGSRMAIELGAVSIDHLDAISDDEINFLAASETIGVITPTVNFNFGSSQFAHARRLIDAGCAAALSTDYNPGSAPCPSQPAAMAIACRYQKLSPAEALNAATINAAFAVGLGGTHGSIEIAKNANCLIIDVEDYREIAYEFGGNAVAALMIDGKIVYDNGRI
ncbi:MAG: imidazolonepropionase [Pyrinomonadaceae bacterium]